MEQNELEYATIKRRSENIFIVIKYNGKYKNIAYLKN
jgi:hypothetical protein